MEYKSGALLLKMVYIEEAPPPISLDTFAGKTEVGGRIND
jgi:hypothetical protein